MTSARSPCSITVSNTDQVKVLGYDVPSQERGKLLDDRVARHAPSQLGHLTLSGGGRSKYVGAGFWALP